MSGTSSLIIKKYLDINKKRQTQVEKNGCKIYMGSLQNSSVGLGSV